jgi:DNA replication licensing factor MCM4
MPFLSTDVMFYLSCRFDLIYLVLDKPDEQNDRRLARHLVALHYKSPEVDFENLCDFV